MKDIVIIGGGHAGIEAAIAAKRQGCKVLMITPYEKRIGEMSCNPAIGGIAKGTLVREIDVLGGSMAEAADETGIQFRMLNRRKGPAVWGPRVQSDAAEYSVNQRMRLKRTGIEILQDEVVGLEGETKRPDGVVCRKAGKILARGIVIATGTFLRGRLYRGRETWRGGRTGDISSDALENDLRRRMFHVKRFKTGTPPRIVRNTVDLKALEIQKDDGEQFCFSHRPVKEHSEKENCYTTRTNTKTINAVKKTLDCSPLFGGFIKGKGPRYCPSFEDKVVKFPERTHHLIHVEPMGLESRLFYINGLSTSLSREAQKMMVRSLPGFAKAEISVYGYAVEYSYFDSSEIDDTLLMTRTENVFAAGQILGTSGYEEAAALGLLAGANAARKALGLSLRVPCRTESYLGVMVDDLVSRGADEPYRLFSSRAENRLHIRQDNAEFRLMHFAEKLGTARSEDISRARIKRKKAEQAVKIMKRTFIDGRKAIEICRRPGMDAVWIKSRVKELSEYSEETVNGVILDEKYRGYIERNRRRVISAKKLHSVSLRGIKSYRNIREICWEAREILDRVKPDTIGEAAGLSGIRPSDIDGLLICLARKRST